MNKKAAIELSVNMIVIIVISMAILGGGLVMFFKAKNAAMDFKDKVDSGTQAQLKSMMLKNNYRVAVYPYQLTLPNKKGGSVGIGITNEFDDAKLFTVSAIDVQYFSRSDLPGVPPNPAWLINNPTTTGGIQHSITGIKINPKEQVAKEILVQMPANAKKGEYVVTVTIQYKNATGTDTYHPYAVTNFVVVN